MQRVAAIGSAQHLQPFPQAPAPRHLRFQPSCVNTKPEEYSAYQRSQMAVLANGKVNPFDTGLNLTLLAPSSIPKIFYL